MITHLFSVTNSLMMLSKEIFMEIIGVAADQKQLSILL